MTTPADIRRLLHRIANSVNIAEARLEHATTALTLATADGHRNTASGRDSGPRGTSELQPTEAAAHTNLGDLHNTHYDETRDQYTTADNYRPGPTIRLADIADELKAALTSLDRAHTAITNCGIPPLLNEQYRCRGINGQGCDEWIDPNRSDHLGINCGRAVDSNRRRLRRHKAAS